MGGLPVVLARLPGVSFLEQRYDVSSELQPGLFVRSLEENDALMKC